MKIIKKILIVFLLGIMLGYNITYASMADYTDEQADNKQKQEQQEWKNNQEEKIGKSSNNYLKSLSVIGYEISPNLDKQTINYEIKEEIAQNSIEIKAEADDEKASVSGTGIVDLNSGENNLRIDVTAENGTVRTYFIKVMCTSNNTLEKKEEETEKSEIYENRISQIQSEDAQKNLKENKSVIYIIVGAVVIFILSILLLKGKQNRKYKGKH